MLVSPEIYGLATKTGSKYGVWANLGKTHTFSNFCGPTQVAPYLVGFIYLKSLSHVKHDNDVDVDISTHHTVEHNIKYQIATTFL